MTVSVVIPWRPGCEHRQANLDLVTAHLDWDVHVGTLDADEPWCKAEAVRRALPTTDVLVIHDADVFVAHEALAEAVHAVENGEPWAMPHRKVRRLSEHATRRLLDGEQHNPNDVARRPYEGVKAGGILVIQRDVYLDCGFDPRFVGWGGEDEALWRALTLLHQPVVRFDAELTHLSHPWELHQMSKPTMQLLARYKGAFRKQDTAAMRQLIEEATCSTSPVS